MTPTSDLDILRRWTLTLIITIAVSIACGRIACVELLYEPSVHIDSVKQDLRLSLQGDRLFQKDRRRTWPPVRPRSMPTFGSNDRSRWATVRSLVDEGTYAIGRRDPQTVVRSALLPLGQLDTYPTTILALAAYAARTKADDGIIFEDGWASVDRVLRPDNLKFYSTKPPLFSTLIAGLYWLLQQIFGWSLDIKNVEHYHPTEVVRTILILVNVIPFAGYLVMLARLAQALGMTEVGKLYIVVAGAFASLISPFLVTLNNHTIAAFCVMAAWVSLLRIWQAIEKEKPTAWYDFIATGFFSSFAATNELPALSFVAVLFALLFWFRLKETLLYFLPAALIPIVGFFATNYLVTGNFKPSYSMFGTVWYEFEGSHWHKPVEGLVRHGIDYAYTKEDRWTYAFHFFVGHHGLFSLGPIWLLAIYSMLREFRRCSLPWFAMPMSLLLSVIVVGYYLFKSDNYGGWTNGPRWLMWLTPLWLTCLLPLADRWSTSRLGRGIMLLALAITIFSVNYNPWSPWRHPWLYDFFIHTGWMEGY